MDLQKEKEAFEEKFNHLDLSFVDDLGYCEIETQTAWEAWQAAKARAVPDGFVLVPKEPTPKMLDATINVPIPAVYVDSISGQHKLKVATYYKAMIEAQEQANDS